MRLSENYNKLRKLFKRVSRTMQQLHPMRLKSAAPSPKTPAVGADEIVPTIHIEMEPAGHAAPDLAANDGTVDPAQAPGESSDD